MMSFSVGDEYQDFVMEEVQEEKSEDESCDSDITVLKRRRRWDSLSLFISA